ncbi:class I SAM-dependent methyltransferase [Kerstersia sp.]|uniref:class I SAM-dependent methyltransferase n=1 Tax=Kerstersia sp. TaxID=1930783 RepID=UPI003F915AE3
MPTSLDALIQRLDPATLAVSQQLHAQLARAIQQAGGALPFDTWMAMALYTPSLGYYSGTQVKLAADPGASAAPQPGSDFITAPELTPAFAATLARQAAEILVQTDTLGVLEFGAGSGALAEGLLDSLDALGLPVRYEILELSADLRARQQARLARFGSRVEWRDTLPASWQGCVIANEVLDAMPVKLFRWQDDGALLERHVSLNQAGRFVWQDLPADAALGALLCGRMPPLPGYVSEINLQAEAWVRDMGRWLQRGAALLIDYGFPRHEYYHPQRAEGTLMCHLRHHAHGDPLLVPGAQDITAHVDFTAMADAALEGGLDVLGYTSQARFLANAGLLEWLSTVDSSDALAYARQVAPIQKLLSEAEMGELFKVLAIGRHVEAPLLGFLRGDRRDML